MTFGAIGLPVAVSIIDGIQYPLRLIVPPRQDALPFERMFSDVVFASIAVLPKNVWWCALPGWPG